MDYALTTTADDLFNLFTTDLFYRKYISNTTTSLTRQLVGFIDQHYFDNSHVPRLHSCSFACEHSCVLAGYVHTTSHTGNPRSYVVKPEQENGTLTNQSTRWSVAHQ